LDFCVDLLKFCVDLLTQKVNANDKKVNANVKKVNANESRPHLSSSALRAPPPKEDRLRRRSLPGLTGAQPNFQFNRGDQFVKENVIA
jgi:hypothetical protein